MYSLCNKQVIIVIDFFLQVTKKQIFTGYIPIILMFSNNDVESSVMY